MQSTLVYVLNLRIQHIRLSLIYKVLIPRLLRHLRLRRRLPSQHSRSVRHFFRLPFLRVTSFPCYGGAPFGLRRISLLPSCLSLHDARKSPCYSLHISIGNMQSRHCSCLSSPRFYAPNLAMLPLSSKGLSSIRSLAC